MQISSFEILAIVRELQELIGAYIDRVYQIGKNEILLRLRKKDIGKVNLLLSAGKFLFKTKKNFETPEKPSMFAMILRKHIEDARISKIYQHDFDRIVVVEAEKKGEIYRLVSECIPNGNIILTDGEWKIIMPLREQTWLHRTIKPKEKYVFPPSKINILDIDLEEFSVVLKNSEKDIVRTLAIDLGLGGTYAEEICLISKLDKNRIAKNLEDEEIEKIFKSTRDLIQYIREGGLDPEIVKEKNNIIAIAPIHLRKFNEYETIKKGSINEALEETFDEIREKKDEDRERMMRQIEQQRKAIDDLLRRSEEKKEEGDTIYMYLKEIDDIISKLMRIIKEKDKEKKIEEIESLDIVESVDIHEGIVRLNLDGKPVDIDFRKSAAENANLAYQLSKKLKEKAKRAKEALGRSEEKLREGKKMEEKGKKFWFERYRWCITSDGNLIIGGKDIRTNERIVKKHMEEKDLYIHADIHGAPSCVLKSRDIYGREKEITERSIKEACQFAGVYSKAWKQFGEVMVYWVYPNQVSKTPESGEFLPKGAFVIRGKRNYMRCKMEMAIGEIYADETRKIMGGPVDSIRARSNRFVILQPGYMRGSDLVKVISKKLGVDPDEITRVLPPGEVQIVEAKGIEIEELK